MTQWSSAMLTVPWAARTARRVTPACRGGRVTVGGLVADDNRLQQARLILRLKALRELNPVPLPELRATFEGIADRESALEILSELGELDQLLDEAADHWKFAPEDLTWVEQSGPFTLPDDLREFLAAHPLNYGTGGGVPETMPETDRVWAIQGAATGTCLGYAWLADRSGAIYHPGWKALVATLPPYQRRGVGEYALGCLIAEARSRSISELHAQVNTNKQPGEAMRFLLVRLGFELLPPKRDTWRAQPDDAIMRHCPLPLFFKLTLVDRDPQSGHE